MPYRPKLLFVMIALLASLACSSGSGSSNDEQANTLAGKHRPYFRVGAAVDSRSYTTHAELLTEHFNSITTENEMKFDALQPGDGIFRFNVADDIVNFALENAMSVRGHALVWHRQTPFWLFQDEDGELVGEELLRQRLRDHITKVVGHFRGKVQIWDVVNEAVMNDGSLRRGDEEATDQQSRWFEVLGEGYIAEAFEVAHEADPDAKLYYNDYYNYLPEKRDGIYDLLKGLLDDGVPVHGVGLQCHLSIAPSEDEEHHSYYQTVENLRESIELYASLGLEVQITELDVSLYIGGMQYEESDFYTEDTFTKKVETEQAERYRDFFELFREQKDAITNVTFWGVADDNTWLSEFSSGRTDFPLLFDTQHEPKKAFDAVMDF